MKKIIIIDFFMAPNLGPDERYDLAVASEAIANGVEAEVWCRRKNDLQPSFVKQCITDSYRGKNKIKMMFKRCFEIRMLLKRIRLETQTIIFIPLIDNFFILPLYLATLGMKISPKIVVVLRRSFLDDFKIFGKCRAWSRKLLNFPFMRFLHKRGTVMFLSDSEIITNELLEEGFDAPVTLPTGQSIRSKKMSVKLAAGSKKIFISIFGGGRYEKGFDVLPSIINYSIDKNPSLFFSVQTFLYEATVIMKNAREELIRLYKQFPNNIELIDTHLSYDQYLGRMWKTDIALVPYRREFYRSGTSGILSEAITCNTWVVVPSDTWLAKQSDKYCKISSFDSLSPESVYKTIGYCVGKLNQKNEMMCEQAEAWYRFHSTSNLFRTLQTL